MGVPVRGRIDDNQHRLQPAAWTLGCGIGPPVLRAQINGGIGWDAARRQLGELLLAIVRKSDIVAHQRGIARIGQHRDGEGGERPVRSIERLAPFGRGRAEAAIGERGGIGRQQDGVRRNGRSVGQAHTGRAPSFDQNFLDAGAETAPRARALRAVPQRLGQPAHTAADQPDAAPLHLRDQRQRRGRFERRTAAIGGVAPEELTQAGIAKMLRHHFPERPIGVQLGEPGKAAQPAAPHQVDRCRGFVGAHEAVFQRIQNGTACTSEIAKTLCVSLSGKAGNGLRTAVRIGEQIERRAVRPEMARQNFGWFDVR